MILKAWGISRRIPIFGTYVFRWFIRIFAPYSASIYPNVMILEPGYCRAMICQRRALGNPFQSIHALALGNLGELVSGLAFLTTIPKGSRGIVTAFNIEYFKKARGRIYGESRTAFPSSDGPFLVEAVLKDESGARVAKTTATWEVGAIQK